MIRLMGAVCVLAGGFLSGRQWIKARKKRQEILMDFATSFRRMCEEIRMARTPLPLLLQEIGKTCCDEVSAVLNAAAQAVLEGGELGETWRGCAEKLSLSREEQDVIAGVGFDLHGDEESVCKAISIAGYQLSAYAGKLDERRRSEEQRVAALCFSASALLVILLI